MNCLENLLVIAIYNCRVLKDLQDWKELPVDCLALSFYNLQTFYLNEIKRGLSGTGTYSLAESYLSLKSTHYEAECVSVDLPEDIVKFIKTKDVSKPAQDEVIFNVDEKVDVPTYAFSRAMHVITSLLTQNYAFLLLNSQWRK